MQRVIIVTDSTVCLPKELIKQYDISVVPNEFVFDNRIYRDGVDITPSQFYKLLGKANRLPSTSPPAPGAYLEVYRHLSQTATGILCITVSSRLSAMFDPARHAQEAAKGLLPETTINVVDSRTAARGAGTRRPRGGKSRCPGKEPSGSHAGSRAHYSKGEGDCAEIYLTDFTPVMGAHAGPGVLALAFWA